MVDGMKPSLAKVWKTSVNAMYAMLLGLCAVMVMQGIFSQAQNKELFAVNEKGEVIIRSYVQGYVCGQIAASEDRKQAYDPEVQLKWTNRVIAPLKTDKFIYSQYMPYLFTFMIPFGALPIVPSFFLWTTFASAICVCGLLILIRHERTFSGVEQLCFFVGVACSLPFLLNVFFGGLSPFILGLIGIYFWALRTNRDIIAGASLALTTLKPQYAIFMALPAVAAVRKRLLVAAALFEGCLLLAAVIDIGLPNVLGYPKLLLSADTSSKYMGVFPERMVSLRGPLTILAPTVATKICLVALVLSLILLIFLWRRTDQKNRTQVNWATSITVICMLIFSPHTHLYDCMYLALLAILNIETLSLTGAASAQPTTYRCWCYMLILYPPLGWCLYLALSRVGYWSSYWALMFHFVLLSLALKGWLDSRSFQSEKANPQASGALTLPECHANIGGVMTGIDESRNDSLMPEPDHAKEPSSETRPTPGQGLH